jgi:hypothetical protein
VRLGAWRVQGRGEIVNKLKKKKSLRDEQFSIYRVHQLLFFSNNRRPDGSGFCVAKRLVYLPDCECAIRT